jgi:hypothetical protein
MEEKLRQKDTTIEKLRLKNSTIKAQITKMEQMLAHKEEMGEVLHLVDFDQLKIENQQYLEKIEERNNELLRLKLSTSRTVQVREAENKEEEAGEEGEGRGGCCFFWWDKEREAAYRYLYQHTVCHTLKTHTCRS